MLPRTILRSYSARVPPKSLLAKQSNRLNKKIQPKDSSKLIVTSLRDIISLFQANSQSQEDDEIESINNKNYINQLIESGELERLAATKLSLDKSTNKIPIEALVNKFPSFTNEEMEIIKEATHIYNSKAWCEYPTYLKQLSYYLSFGSYGPRNDIPFVLNKKPIDFTFKNRSTTKSAIAKRLNKDQLTNRFYVTEQRKHHFSPTTLDPMSKFVFFSAIGVSAVVGWYEWQLEKQDSK
ncbi:hypothetical protein HG535_0G02090 [Zygotorulaspora mrakii]|uniref:Genetic interactor of prohibitin 7, mitochondrial n=1 Tax=Zygotorulaspora mrakii TaxID=42260 RepID=A0A7H9B6H4_ZYGMR|nr:uncharacterized protein HG535_0G02090 [Zygotorulaspora mrakii]QLG74325.1 hypothetical protein HG535_0G02090 [Zygotorulaspora mrakii]